MYKDLLKDMFRVYESDGDLSPEEQALVMELVPIQKRINALEAKMAELKDKKKELSGPVIAAMKRLELQNIRISNILVSFVKGGVTPPSFKAVMDVVRNQLEPAVAKLLDDTYASIGKEKEDYLKIKTEKVQEDIWAGIKDFFTRVFDQLVGGVSAALGKIEGILGISNVQEDGTWLGSPKPVPPQMPDMKVKEDAKSVVGSADMKNQVILTTPLYNAIVDALDTAMRYSEGDNLQEVHAKVLKALNMLKAAEQSSGEVGGR